jgi:nucleoside-diphosphate-sugar epimerase
MRIFLTGATGVIGRRALPLLIGAGHSVTAVVRRPQSHAELVRAGATPIEVDLFAADAVRKAVAGHDAVVNLATHMPAGYRAFLPGAWAENDRIRRFASANLVDAAMATGATRFIQESFAPVYPDRGEAWIDERTPIAPVRYNRSVIDAERSAQRFSSGGRTGVVLRFAAFYGPDSWFTRDLIRYVRRGFVPLPGAADSFISSVSHDDAATAVMGALFARAGIYNVVDDEPVRRREFVGSLAETLGVPAPKLAPPWMKYLFGSLGEMLARSLRITNRKLREECAWVPKYPTVREGWRAVAAAIPASSQVSGAAR